jgi:hypothetical protein
MRVHQALVNDTAGGWVHKAATWIFDKESLVDSFVHHNDSDRRLLRLVSVELPNSLFELRDLIVQHLVALSVAHAISVDYEVGRELTIVVLSEDLDRVFTKFAHLGLHDLLALPLHQVVTEVL